MRNEAFKAKQPARFLPEIAVGSRKHDRAIYGPVCSSNTKAHEGASVMHFMTIEHGVQHQAMFQVL
jgi:hypothetical protein